MFQNDLSHDKVDNTTCIFDQMLCVGKKTTYPLLLLLDLDLLDDLLTGLRDLFTGLRLLLRPDELKREIN